MVMKPLHEAEAVEDHLDHRHQAVGGAARVGETWCLAGSYVLVVHAVDDGDVFLLGRRGDDHLLGAALQVERGLVAVGEPAGGLEHDVHAEVLPGELGRILLREHPHGVAVRPRARPLVGRDVAREAAVDRVVLEQVGERLGVGDVVHRDEVELLGAHRLGGPHHVAPDPPEAVDADSNRHRPLRRLDALRQRPRGGSARANVTASTRAAPAAAKRDRRLGERRAGGEDVVHQHHASPRPARRPRTRPPRWLAGLGRERGLGRASPAPGGAGRARTATARAARPAPRRCARSGCNPGSASRRAPSGTGIKHTRPVNGSRAPHRIGQRASGDPPPALVLEPVDGVAARRPRARRRSGPASRPGGQPAQIRHSRSPKAGWPQRCAERSGDRLPAGPAELADQRVALAAGIGAWHRRHAGGSSHRSSSTGRAATAACSEGAASTAARMTSTGRSAPGNQRSSATAPCATSIARPSAARRPAARMARHPRRSRPGGTPCRAPHRALGTAAAAAGSGSLAGEAERSRVHHHGALGRAGARADPRASAHSSSAARPLGATGSATATPAPRRAAPPPRGARAAAGADDEPRAWRRAPAALAPRGPRPRRCCRRRIAPSSAPEGVAHPHLASRVQQPVHRPRRDFLMGDGDVAAAARGRRAREQRRHVRRSRTGARRTPPAAQGPERGVLHGGRKGMRDRIAQEREDARAAVDHRTVPASRLMTAPISSSSSA